MAFIYLKNYTELSKRVGEDVISIIQNMDSCFIGLATGYSPQMLYEYISKKLIDLPELTEKITAIQLDEWLGLNNGEIGSCQKYINDKVIIPWKLKEEQCITIDGSIGNEQNAVEDLTSYLNARRMNVCILGLGTNGHLALNEPESSIDSTCRIVTLAPSSKEHDMLKNSEAKINKGITVGLKEIMESDEIKLLITGEQKKEAYFRLKKKEDPSSFPASLILQHKNWTCYVDESSIL